MEISKKYEETKSKLVEKLRVNKLKVLERDKVNYLGVEMRTICYLCQKEIRGKKKLLIDKDEDFESKYVIGNDCYAKAKGIWIVRN